MKADANPDMVKVQFESTVGTSERIDELVKVSDAPSRAELIRRAIRLFGFLLTECDLSAGVEVTRKDGRKVTLMPNLL